MKNKENNKWSEQIDAYLKGELSNAERLSFEEQLNGDIDLKQEVKFRQQVINTLKEESHLSDFRQLQKEIEEEIETPPPGAFKWLYILLPILLLLSALYFYWFQSSQHSQELNTSEQYQEEQKENLQKIQQDPVPSSPDDINTAPASSPAETPESAKPEAPIASNQETSTPKALLLALADQYLQNQLIGQVDLDIERGSPQEDSLLNQALYTFNQQDYQAAFPLLIALSKSQPQQSQLFYPLGICYLYHDPKKALSFLLKAFKNNRINREQWHLALAYLKTGAIEEARKNLQEIIKESMNHNDPYRINAIQLLQKIDAINNE